MAYNPTNWKDRVVEKPRTFTMQDNGDGTVTLIPAPGTILEPGTPVNATNLNKLEQGLKSHEADNVAEGNPNNPHGISKEAIGLGNVLNYGLATKTEAEAGSSNTKYMTPLRVAEALLAQGTRYAVGSYSGQTGSSQLRFINLGFTPKFLIIIPMGTIGSKDSRLSFNIQNVGRYFTDSSIKDHDSAFIARRIGKIVTNGFNVNYELNESGNVYHYVAIGGK